MLQNLHGKTAIVTGAGSGINLEFSRRLLEAGVNVLIADLALQPEAEALIWKYRRSPKAVFKRTDVVSWPELNDMFAAAHKHFGTIDIVCPGAGIFEPAWTNFWHPPGIGPSRDDPAGGRYKVMDINVTHPIRVTQLAISYFLNAPQPASPTNPKAIVHLGSIAGQTASLPYPLYHASKHAIHGFVYSLADLDEHYGIRVNAVVPGLVKTPIWTGDPDKLRLVDETQDEWVMPEEIARVMIALVRDNETKNPEDGTPIPIKGGTMLEVVKGSIRSVPLLSNPGPPAGKVKGLVVSNIQKSV